jgi:hypothetical protein
MSPFVRSLAAGAVWAAVGLAAVVPFLLWGNDKAPEFYGAFMAAIVAAIAVVLGAYYQAELTRRRDDALAREARIAEAMDLFLWIENAIGEMEFIGEMLNRFSKRLKEDSADKLDLSLERYREIVSSKFMEELRDRAKSASRLSPIIGVLVAPILYDTFLAADRIYRFRGASLDAKFSPEQIERHILVTSARIVKLKDAQEAIMIFLEKNGLARITFEHRLT